jgi:TrmH family RNA methyltransferase
MPKLLPYRKDLDYSYCLGVFPCLELIQARPDSVRRLLLDPRGEENTGVQKLTALCERRGIRREYSPKLLSRISRKDNCYAALVFDKYEDTLSPGACHVVLHHISDSGNLGTILRTWLGFGGMDLAIIRPAVDFFDPHALRASMGAAFKLRVRQYDRFEDYAKDFPGHRLYPFMLQGALPLEEAAAAARSPYSLIFGNEGAGLPEVFAGMGQSVVIPHRDSIDSLNLSVAAALGMYAFGRAGNPGGER